MIKNYLLVTWRNALSHKGYTAINVIGLSLGIAVTVLLLLFVVHEMSYDTFHYNKDRIFRVKAEIKFGEQTIYANAMSAPFGPLAKEATASIENYVRMRPPGRVVVQSNDDTKFFEDHFIFTDPAFFSVFSFKLLSGDATELSKPGKVFITPAVAEKYFGKEEAIGRYITYQASTQLEIIGLVEPAPSHSSLQFDFVASFPTLGLLNDKNETGQYKHELASLGAYQTYLLLGKADQKQEAEVAISKIVKPSAQEKYFLEPLLQLPSNLGRLIVFSSVAVLVLILALVNYMNLTTARATTRAREVGLRKVAGATRRAVAFQFYLESATITMVAFIIAYMLVAMVFPFVKPWLGADISAAFLSSPVFILLVVMVLFTCVFLAGSYPALVLSGFKPVLALKGQQGGATKGPWIRKGLTAFQFATSMVLIFSSLIIHNQLSFLRNREIGLNKDQVLVVSTEGLGKTLSAFRNEVTQLTSVKQTGQASVSLFKDGGMAGYFTKTPTTNEEVFINVITVDADFFRTLEIPWHKQPDERLRSGDRIINQSALEKLKITEKDLGVIIPLGTSAGPITGIVKDFNYTSLKEKISGVLFFVSDADRNGLLGERGSLYIRLQSENLMSTLTQIRSLYEAQRPTSPFEFYFLDDAFEQLYQEEDRMAWLFRAFTCLAIGVACLGLLGLVTFTTERKTREIGIRKVLGASEFSIVHLITGEFSLVMVVGIVFAIPIGWWAMETWLEKFPYRVELTATSFFVGGLLVLGLGLITITIQATKAALANPVKSLRSE